MRKLILFAVILYSCLSFGQCTYNLDISKSSTTPDWSPSTNIEVKINGVSSFFTLPSGVDYQNFPISINDNDLVEIYKHIDTADATNNNVGVSFVTSNGIYLVDERLKFPQSSLVYSSNLFCATTCDFVDLPTSFVDPTSTTEIFVDVYSFNFSSTTWLFEYDTVASFDSSNLVTSTITNTSLTLSNLSPDTLYYLRFTEVCATGNPYQVVFSARTLFNGCRDVWSVNVMPVTVVEAKVNFAAGDTETIWDVEYGIAPYTQGTGGNSFTINNSSEFSMNNLNIGDSYDIYIRSQCSTTSFGNWVSYNYTHSDFVINFPDPILKASLISQNVVDTNGDDILDSNVDLNSDGEITATEAIQTTNLDLSTYDITDLTGIRNFLNVTNLTLNQNDFINADLSDMSAIEILDIGRGSMHETIDISGCINLKELYLRSGHINSLEVSDCINLEILEINSSDIQQLDLSQNINLRIFDAEFAAISNLDFSNNILLESIYLDYTTNWNTMTTINLSNLSLVESIVIKDSLINFLNTDSCVNLELLNLFNSQLFGVNTTMNPNLRELILRGNRMSNLDVSQNLALEYLSYSSDNLSSPTDLSNNINLKYLIINDTPQNILNVSSNINLETLYLDNLPISNIDLTTNVNLENIRLKDVNLTNLDVTNNINLKDLEIDNSLITTFDLSNNLILERLYFRNTTFNNLDLTPNVNLKSFGVVNSTCNNCPTENLTDLSQNTNLEIFNVQSNNSIQKIRLDQHPKLEYLGLFELPALQQINIKSNIINPANFATGIIYNTNPDYVCSDNSLLPYLTQQFTAVNINNVVFNTYCSFNPGGNFNEIEGNISIDIDNNGCDPTDPVFPNFNFTATDGINTGTISSNQAGEYYVPVADGQHTITPNPENPTYWNISPPNVVVDFPTQASPFTQDFCVTANGTVEDLEVIVVPLEQARPGFDTDYKVVVKNKGNQTASGAVTLDFEEDFMTLLSTNPTAGNTPSNQLSWSFTGLQPFQMEEYEFTMTLNTPTQTTNPLNSNDILTFTGTVTGTGTDAMPADNVMVFDQTVVNSYDPNDKTCLEGETIDPADVGEYVHYMIRFENTGTASAINVVIKDEIDLSQFDITTLIPLGGSHDYYTRIREGNVVEFIHEDINLDFNDATNDGHVLFKIKTLNTLVAGDTFDNTAEIFFDFNFPIITNMESVTVMSTASIGETTDSSIKLYPNPAKSFINFSATNSLESVTIMDINGRTLSQTNFTGNSTNQRISLENLSSGIYFVTVKSDLGQKVEKLIVK
ncbi:hypothetical protein BST92_12690 [Nonlabens arenilitoris]|uniref:Fibronectin type-III domain-containing protein n=1 Tax=Nonlabens arenilitoris TaxID=1217969 RepID=A0A2S7UCR5_9FLAO|nr:T9SS type A sorting domain-containing protein [Nonlabens arenilitoris]PQJ32725.1 hypothetical protein BST92_12690 [Nonlabens arenilitoris]